MAIKPLERKKYILFIAFLFAALAPLHAFAGNNDCRPITNEPAFVQKFTNYAPAARPGDMNGRCGTSASGYDACKFLLEDHLAGRASVVMVAVPQKGGTSDLFGGIYQGKALEQGLGTNNCIRVFAGDRYNTQSNGMSKMDVVTRAESSRLTQLVNQSQGPLYLLGRAPNMKPPLRKVERIPEAVSPPEPVDDSLAEFFKLLFGTAEAK